MCAEFVNHYANMQDITDIEDKILYLHNVDFMHY